MKILLVHNGNFETLLKVKGWRKNKSGLGEFYELSIILGSIKKDDLKYLSSQIQKSIKLYGIEKILFFQFPQKTTKFLKEISKKIDFEFLNL